MAVSVGKPRVEGREDYPELTRGGPYANLVSAGYIETMGIRGRLTKARVDAVRDAADQRPDQVLRVLRSWLASEAEA